MPIVSSTAITGYIAKELKSLPEWLETTERSGILYQWLDSFDQEFALSNILGILQGHVALGQEIMALSRKRVDLA